MSIKIRITNFLKGSTEREDESQETDYICKVVKQDGKRIGESIAVDDGLLLVKDKKDILAIPLDSISAVSDDIIVGKFNKTKAKRVGKQWKNEGADEIKFDENGMLIQ